MKSKHIKETRRYIRKPKQHFISQEILATQAFRLLEKFGGARGLVRALARVGEYKNPSSVYRWLYPKEAGGTGGLVPSKMWPAIMRASRIEGVLLTPEDMDPRAVHRETSAVIEEINSRGEVIRGPSVKAQRVFGIKGEA